MKVKMAMYQIHIFKRINRIVLISTLFLFSCEDKKRVEQSKISKEQHISHIVEHNGVGILDTACCYNFFDSLMKTNVNEEQAFDKIYKAVIRSKNASCRDYGLFFWFLDKSNDAALNESMGRYIYEELIKGKNKQKEISTYINQFPLTLGCKLRVDLINIMDIDLTDNGYDAKKFKIDFPFFADSLSIHTANGIFNSSSIGEE